MDMTIKDEIEQLILRCIASDGLKACPKDLAFLEKYGLKNLFFFSVEYGMCGYTVTRRQGEKPDKMEPLCDGLPSPAAYV